MEVDEGYDPTARPLSRHILGVVDPGESVSIPVNVLRPDPHTRWEVSLRPHLPPTKEGGASEVFSWGHESAVGPLQGGEGASELTRAVDDRSASALFQPSGVRASPLFR